MNIVIISLILFALFGIHTCVDLQKSSLSPDTSKSDTTDDHGRSLQLAKDKKDNDRSDEQPGDHDQDEKSASSKSSVKARKGAVYTNDTDESSVKSTEVHTSNDRASTTLSKTSESVPNSTVEVSSPAKSNVRTDSERTSSSGSYKYSPYESKSTKYDTSSSAYIKDSNSTSSNYSKSSATITGSTESTSYTKSSSKYSSKSSSKSSSIPPKPSITYSVEDEPSLKIPITRQNIPPLTPTDARSEADNQDYLPPSSDFDRMQSKRDMYIFPLVVLIFLVPMILGVGIIILRRVRDYWSTRHYRRMDFLVDGMYNT